MNPISDELLRGALADAAATVTPQSLRPLRAKRRSRRIARTVITVAVAAVLVITAVMVENRSRTPAPGPWSLAGSVGLRYIVEGAGPPGGVVTVKDAATRKELAVVTPPKGTGGFWNIGRTADDQVYVLTTFDRLSLTVHFYRLHLGSGGVPDELTELPRAALQGQPGGIASPEILAVTPDGTKLAYVTGSGATVRYEGGSYEMTGDEHVREWITLIDLQTWARHVVELPKATGTNKLMWAADGKHLFFGQTPLVAGDSAHEGLYVTDAQGAAVRRVKLGLPGTDFIWQFPAGEGNDIVAMTHRDGRYGLSWYSLAKDAITHRADLGPGNDVGIDIINRGDRIALSIGDHVYTVRGTTVRKRPKPRT